ncbi:MAG TPA: TIGR03435 family protein [Bryobacteraceae bacterium]|nr:TIGR03435 family protein [Bryobacteraceae bacterium]
MRRIVLPALLGAGASLLMLGQATDTRPKFQAASVEVAPAGAQGFRNMPGRDGRYTLKNATMLDLVRIAYGFDADKILGGPSWLELDHFDIVAKPPGETSPDDEKLMLQTLLEDRFKLAVHKETKPIPGYALTAPKKPSLKEAAGSEESGCKPQAAAGAQSEGGSGTLFIAGAGGGNPVRIALGPGAMITYVCRNTTMAAFAQGLRSMIGANIGTSPVLEETGLKGAWNFDVTYSLGLVGLAAGGSADRVSLAEAIDKQLGLKLEERQVPTPVLIVDGANRTPTPNAPDLSQVMPPIPPVTQFDVASVKPSDPGSSNGSMGVQVGGRLNVHGMPMRTLLMLTFRDPLNLRTMQIVGLPKWADSDHFDIVAKAPPDAAQLDMMSIGPPMQALLKERFKLEYHIEQQPQPAFTLETGKPKMKKADPASRTSCKRANAPAGSPGGSQMIACQNITMAQFADWMSYNGVGLNGPVSDATGLDGAWDFTLTFNFQAMAAARGGDGPDAGAQTPVAADPQSGYTISEAIEKELGLKLESTKKPQPVIVVDHIEEKPTEDQ